MAPSNADSLVIVEEVKETPRQEDQTPRLTICPPVEPEPELDEEDVEELKHNLTIQIEIMAGIYQNING